MLMNERCKNSKKSVNISAWDWNESHEMKNQLGITGNLYK